jgi:hypothetical protein
MTSKNKMDYLTNYDLKEKPPKIFIDKEEEINILDLNYNLLISAFNKMKEKIKKKDTIEIDTICKLRLLINNIDNMVNIIDDINISFDIEGKWKLTEEDLERININRETNKIFKTFIPYMLTYKLLTDVSKLENI